MSGQEMMEYKGYTAVLESDEENGGWTGDIPGMDEWFVLEAESLPEMQQAVKEILDYYLDKCEKKGKPPCKQNVEALAQAVG